MQNSSFCTCEMRLHLTELLPLLPKFIIFNTKSIILNAKFISFDKQSIIFNLKKIHPSADIP